MRSAAHMLLVLLALAGLALPNAAAHVHEVRCDTPASCGALPVTDCHDAQACHHPTPPAPCPCHHEHDSDEAPGHSPDEPGGQDDGDGSLPRPHEHHHHHHHCVCGTASAGLISESDSVSLHPPLGGPSLAVREYLRAPEAPVYLLDRPPIS